MLGLCVLTSRHMRGQRHGDVALDAVHAYLQEGHLC